DKPLDTFTFVPRADWDGIVPPDLMGDERPFVEAFAAMHPRLRTHFTDNGDEGFDAREQSFFLAMSGAPSHLPTFQAYQGVFGAARDQGCDWLLHALLGNASFSADGAWSYREDLVRGHWHQLCQTLSRRRGDPRPLWRKLLAMSILPLLPVGLADAARRLVHPARGSFEQTNSVLRDEVASDPRLIERQQADAAFRARGTFRDRDEMVAFVYRTCDAEGAEVMQAAEQIFGVRQRDVTAYRPLIEFCLGLPTRQFVSNGEERWLAKRMAKGRMPEAQRLNPRYGRHNVDWHARMTPRVGELAAEANRLRDDPWFGELLDVDRIEALLTDWPEQTPWAPEEAYPRMIGITRAIQAARFVRFAEGRNEP
ncbi:MAG: asparagine synthase-related protein, partial [Phenylobacterium sp.]